MLCPDHVKRQADDGTKAGVPHTVNDPANPTATTSRDQDLPQDAADDYHFKLASLAPVDLVDLDQKDMGLLDHPASFLSREATGRYSCAEIAEAAGPRPPRGPTLHTRRGARARPPGRALRTPQPHQTPDPDP